MNYNTILSAIIGLLAFCFSYLFLGVYNVPNSLKSVTNSYGPKYAQRSDYVGLSEEDAKNKAKKEGMKVRIISRDGQEYPGTADYRTDRINVVIIDGIIVGAYYG